MFRILLFIVLSVSSFSTFAKETRKKIAILDTGLKKYSHILPFLCEAGHKSMIQEPIYSPVWTDKIGHGTNVAGLIVRFLNPKKQCIVIIKVYYKYASGEETYYALIRGINYARTIKASMINLSVAGVGEPTLEEFGVIQKGIKEKIRFSVAAGNRSGVGGLPINLDKLCNVFPACYIKYFGSKYFHVVGSYTGSYSNYGKTVTYWEDGTNRGIPIMSGTSQATAIHTGKWAKQLWGGNK